MGNLQRSLSPSSSSSSSTCSSSTLDSHPLSIDPEIWLMAEQRIQEILCIIQPALASEEKRKEVIDYIQGLISECFVTEVFPVGSVPLKTYLPDGDIDLIVISHQNVEEDLARQVCSVLECEEQESELEVKDIQYVQAQVKIVKCTVNDISVDISFNKMEGLCALCFLEQVDQFIGKDHLLKRSIILIKAWCYYESRILGAHFGLIATYALEIMILWIINLFHASLQGPLAVLSKFLDYYSTFDWENYCVTINGPIAKSSLLEVGGTPEKDGNDLLLSQEFLKNCGEIFSVPIKAVEKQDHEFPIKYVNIVDPLKNNNNLGRSINKATFRRIQAALSLGAQRLNEVLSLPGERMGAGLEKLFANTLDRTGRGQRPDAQAPVPAFGTGRCEVPDLAGEYGRFYHGLLYGQQYHNYIMPILPQLSPPSSPSQIHQKNTWDALSYLLRHQQIVFPKRGTDVFFPRESLYHTFTTKQNGVIPQRNGVGKCRGTGTYIPQLTYQRYRDWLSWKRATNQDSSVHFSSPRSTQKTDSVEQFPETKKRINGRCIDASQDQFTAKMEKRKNGSCFNLSLDQFPGLPCTKKSMPSEVHQTCQDISKSCQNKDCSDPVDIIRFGSFDCLPSSLVQTQSSSGVSATFGTITVVPEAELQIQQQFHEEMYEFPAILLP
ncbi:hypothetical protein Tsubulata_017540 [Turnera subulata]|uniref:Polymerase nucleotidyl transferase domain-containing protein n=1 Tax=Turnera subulata TaxID=218843 RepID=A0A9Q0FFJ0_9ROSI|nr:hypothetical protein Tsubulata_017540 [Turnera subulata]